ncbi:helix-turn-helix domain-containing protein [Ihubacter sp. rT4E-8]|uniref:helix-turn-helix domain-containing protein n=1 Tax=Ihubacter sp. rT4E-8 TaxID=3242369 RepID=UPI003CF45208
MVFEKVEALCEKKGISIYRAEKDMGLSPSSICKWKESMPAANTLKILAEYFNVPISYFLED